MDGIDNEDLKDPSLDWSDCEMNENGDNDDLQVIKQSFRDGTRSKRHSIPALSQRCEKRITKHSAFVKRLTNKPPNHQSKNKNLLAKVSNMKDKGSNRLHKVEPKILEKPQQESMNRRKTLKDDNDLMDTVLSSSLSDLSITDNDNEKHIKNRHPKTALKSKGKKNHNPVVNLPSWYVEGMKKLSKMDKDCYKFNNLKLLKMKAEVFDVNNPHDVGVAMKKSNLQCPERIKNKVKIEEKISNAKVKQSHTTTQINKNKNDKTLHSASVIQKVANPSKFSIQKTFKLLEPLKESHKRAKCSTNKESVRLIEIPIKPKIPLKDLTDKTPVEKKEPIEQTVNLATMSTCFTVVTSKLSEPFNESHKRTKCSANKESARLSEMPIESKIPPKVLTNMMPIEQKEQVEQTANLAMMSTGFTVVTSIDNAEEFSLIEKPSSKPIDDQINHFESPILHELPIVITFCQSPDTEIPLIDLCTSPKKCDIENSPKKMASCQLEYQYLKKDCDMTEIVDLTKNDSQGPFIENFNDSVSIELPPTLTNSNADEMCPPISNLFVRPKSPELFSSTETEPLLVNFDFPCDRFDTFIESQLTPYGVSFLDSTPICLASISEAVSKFDFRRKIEDKTKGMNKERISSPDMFAIRSSEEVELTNHHLVNFPICYEKVNNPAPDLDATFCTEIEISGNGIVAANMDNTYCSEWENSNRETTGLSLAERYFLPKKISPIISGTSTSQNINSQWQPQSLLEIVGDSSFPPLHKELFANIENSVLQSLEFLCRSKHFEFSKLRSERGYDSYNEQSQQMECSGQTTTIRMTDIAHKAMFLHLLSKINRMNKYGTSCTKRELQYSTPTLLQNKHNVNTVIKNICMIFNIWQWQLGIYSSSKGQVAGKLTLIMSNDEVVKCDHMAGGITFPLRTPDIKRIDTAAEFILLIEKETIFAKLLQQNVLEQFGGNFILVTGKGFPDINTRIFLKKIWEQHQLPIFALVDANPYGMEILFTYRHGSLAMASSAEYLAVPSIQWIGLFPSEMRSLRLQTIPLSQCDNDRLKSLIKRPYISESLFLELSVLQNDQCKAELEALSVNEPTFLINNYLQNKLKNILNQIL